MNAVFTDFSSTVSYKYLELCDELNYATTQEQHCIIEIVSSACISVYQYEMLDQSTIRTEPVSFHSYSRGEQVELLKGKIYKVVVHKLGLAVMANNNEMGITRSIFCTGSGRLISTLATNNQHSKLQFAAYLLGVLKRSESKEVLRSLLNHSAYFVRWQAAQSFALLAEKEEIIDVLHIMSSDENNMIAKAAQSSLQRLVN